MLLPLLRNLDQAGGPAEVAPSHAGMEYTVEPSRLHFTIRNWYRVAVQFVVAARAMLDRRLNHANG